MFSSSLSDLAYSDFCHAKVLGFVFVFLNVVFYYIWILNYNSKAFPYTQIIKESICVFF